MPVFARAGFTKFLGNKRFFMTDLCGGDINRVCKKKFIEVTIISFCGIIGKTAWKPVKRLDRIRYHGQQPAEERRRAESEYFLTLCALEKKCIFSEIEKLPSGKVAVRLAPVGFIIEEALKEMREMYPQIRQGEHVVMPNHLHILLSVETDSRLGLHSNKWISVFVTALKRLVNRKIGEEVWGQECQQQLMDGRGDSMRCRKYIRENPLHWERDSFYPSVFAGCR